MPSLKRPSISAFFPCYNDSKTIGQLVIDALTILKELTDDYEVIVVDDGSTDASRSVLENLAKKHRKLKLIFHQKNLGYGSALQTGFKTATKELIFYTDGDGQYDVKELPLLYMIMTPDVDFVNGIKMTRAYRANRIIIGKVYSFMTRWLFLLPIYDTDCDFRLIRKKIIDKLNFTSFSGSICVELIKRAQLAGAKFREVSIHHYERRWGESQFFVPRRILSTLWELGILWFRLMVLDKTFKRN